MRDECFEVFIDEFGEATHRDAVPASSIEKWRGKLPDQLLTYWKEEGWCGYANGLLQYSCVIAGETEKYWCGIKHQFNEEFCEPQHHADFIQYGDEDAYRKLG